MAEHQKQAARTRRERYQLEILTSVEKLVREGFMLESDAQGVVDDIERLNAVELQQTAAALRD